jgi:hypothetical protein
LAEPGVLRHRSSVAPVDFTWSATWNNRKLETLSEPPSRARNQKITPNDKGNPPGKLADAELHFIDGELDGLKLIGFSIWERRGGGGRNVTFPARSYAINGERRTYALLRPIADVESQNRIRDLVLQAFDSYEDRAEAVS